MRSAIWDLFRPLRLVQQKRVFEHTAHLVSLEPICFEEQSNRSICLECIVNGPALFSEVVYHLHEFGQLERPWVEATLHDHLVHGSYHEHQFSVSFDRAWFLIGLMPAVLEDYNFVSCWMWGVYRSNTFALLAVDVPHEVSMHGHVIANILLQAAECIAHGMHEVGRVLLDQLRDLFRAGWIAKNG
jgi:hypothetical protein